MSRFAFCVIIWALGAFAAAAQTDVSETRRCDATGTNCITLEAYIPGVCAQIARAARYHDLDQGFFARLLWQESRFDAGAVSPAGAEGIAQFIPSTAALRDLDDPFNPVLAIDASAEYLTELRDRFGSLGLAAVAYNAGESRAQAFVSGHDWLPEETETYVMRITGLTALQWRDDDPAPDLRLDGDTPFRQACLAQARGRGIAAFQVPGARAQPWGAIVAVHAQRAVLLRKLRDLPLSETPDIIRRPMPGRSRPVYTAQFGYEDGPAAARRCARFQARGVSCIVLRNRR